MSWTSTRTRGTLWHTTMAPRRRSRSSAKADSDGRREVVSKWGTPKYANKGFLPPGLKGFLPYFPGILLSTKHHPCKWPVSRRCQTELTVLPLSNNALHFAGGLSAKIKGALPKIGPVLLSSRKEHDQPKSIALRKAGLYDHAARLTKLTGSPR